MSDDKVQRGIIKMAFNGEMGVDGGDHVTFPAVIAAQGVYDDDNGQAGYRNGEESQKMIPLCNGLRIMEKHPKDDLYQFIGADLKDEDFPVFGVTGNATESPNKGKNDEVRIATDMRIDKVDRAGNDRTPMINGMKDGSINEISIQYFFIKVAGEGEFGGKHYDYLETDVNPYGLGVMTDGWKAKCPADTCSIGASGDDPDGDDEMATPKAPPDEGDKKEATLEDVHAAIAGMEVDCIAKHSEGVNAALKKAKRAEELEESNTQLMKDAEENKASLERLADLDKAKAKEEAEELEQAKTYMKDRMGEDVYKERFPAEVDVDLAELTKERTYLDKVAPLPEPAALAPPEDPEKGQNATDPNLFWGLNGKGTREDPPSDTPDPDDGLMPMNRK